MIPKYLLTAIVVVVSVVFLADFAAQFVIADYQSNPAVVGVFGLIAGAAFTLAQRQGGKDPDPPAGDKPEPPS